MPGGTRRAPGLPCLLIDPCIFHHTCRALISGPVNLHLSSLLSRPPPHAIHATNATHATHATAGLGCGRMLTGDDDLEAIRAFKAPALHRCTYTIPYTHPRGRTDKMHPCAARSRAQERKKQEEAKATGLTRHIDKLVDRLLAVRETPRLGSVSWKGILGLTRRGAGRAGGIGVERVASGRASGLSEWWCARAGTLEEGFWLGSETGLTVNHQSSSQLRPQASLVNDLRTRGW